MKYLALLLTLLCGPAFAQGGMGPGPGTVHSTGGGGGYTGPGDIQSGAVVFLSCTRAYSAAYAASLGSACDIFRASDSTTCTVKVAASGLVDWTVGTPCTGGTQTGTAFCNATVCQASKAYDQTGNGNHFTNGVSAPFIAFSAINGLPSINITGASGQQGLDIASFTQAQPMTVAGVAHFNVNLTNRFLFISTINSTGLYVDTTDAQWATYAGGSNLDVAATFDVAHHFQAIFDGTNSGSGFNIDGSLTAATSGHPGTAGFLGATGWGGSQVNTSASWRGYLPEIGVWPSAFSSGTQSTMHTNAVAFYGTP